MQAPLRKGKREETLGRAKGVKRTGRSLLFAIVLVAIIVSSSLIYTSERLIVEAMAKQNLACKKQLEAIQKRADRLTYEVAQLEAFDRLTAVATELGLVPIDWEKVYVIKGSQVGRDETR